MKNLTTKTTEENEETITISLKDLKFYKALHFYSNEIVKGLSVEEANRGLTRVITKHNTKPTYELK